MPLQELSPLPPITGYSTLGGVISNLGQDQLQRAAQLQDAQAMDTFRARQAGIQLLINEGYLDGSQRDNPEAVQAAYNQAKADGVDKRYFELYQTPDETGQPLLKPADAGNAQLVQAAKEKLGAIKAKQLQFQMGQPANAQATVNDIQNQLAQVRAQKEAITQKANEPAPQYSPNDAKVVALAQQLAEQQKPGSGRNREAVAAQMPIAYKQLNDQAFVAWSQNVQSAKIELESLRRTEAELTDALVRTSQTFKVAPSVRPTAAPSMLQNPAASAPRVASAEDIAAAMRAAIGGQSAPSSAAPDAASSGLLENPTNDPTISAGNEMLQRQRVATVQNQLNEAIQTGAKIEAQINSARNTSAPMTIPAFGGGLGGPSPVQTQAPAGVLGAAQQVSSLLKAKAENEARIKALQAQLAGPAPATSTAPAINTPTSSTPTLGVGAYQAGWWKNPNPASIGGM